MPDEVDFCFQVDDHFYAAGSVRREYREQQEVSHCWWSKERVLGWSWKISKLWSSLPESVSAWPGCMTTRYSAGLPALTT